MTQTVSLPRFIDSSINSLSVSSAMSSSPTQRSLEALRRDGWTAAIVERWNGFAKIRQDLFGWMDILAVHPRFGITAGVQTTTRSNMKTRVKKILANDRAEKWLLAGNLIFVHGWAKRKERGKSRPHYELVSQWITAADFARGKWDGAE